MNSPFTIISVACGPPPARPRERAPQKHEPAGEPPGSDRSRELRASEAGRAGRRVERV